MPTLKFNVVQEIVLKSANINAKALRYKTVRNGDTARIMGAIHIMAICRKSNCTILIFAVLAE